MSAIAFFDANSQIGHYNYRVLGAPHSLEALRRDMAEQGIARRLVHHALAKEHSPAVGNERLLAEIAGAPELHPVWAATTWVTGEAPEPDDFVAALRRHGVRAVRFFRHFYRVPMAEWSLGRLWSALEEHRLPLILDLGERWAAIDEVDTGEVYGLCRAHPDLPVILTKHRIRYNRQVYQLFDACPNLRLEVSGYWHYRAVEDICARFGAHRLIFGTNWPYMDSSFAMAMVMYAEVDDEAKAAVAGGNLAALLEAVQW